MAVAALSNRVLVLGSAGVVVAVAALLVAVPRPTPRSGSSDGSLEVQRAAQPSELPRVTTVKDFVAGLTGSERICLEGAVGVAEVAALEQGRAAITDAQLQALGACVNPGLPNSAAVVE